MDEALEPIIDGLRLQPYGFELHEDDFVRFRYAWVAKTEFTPSIAVIYRIEKDKNVVLERIEEVPDR